MDFLTFLALFGTGYQVAGQAKLAEYQVAQERAQANYHAYVLERDAAYADLNAEIARNNQRRITSGFEDALEDIGKEGRDQISESIVRGSASGLDINSPSYRQARVEARKEIYSNIERAGKAYADNIQDQKIAEAQAIAQAADLRQDAEETRRQGRIQAKGTSAAGFFNAGATLISGVSAYNSIIGSASRNPYKNQFSGAY